jgi:hypothetical protein
VSEDVDAADADKGWPLLDGKELVVLRSLLPMSDGDDREVDDDDDDGEQHPAVVRGSPSGLEP